MAGSMPACCYCRSLTSAPISRGCFGPRWHREFFGMGRRSLAPGSGVARPTPDRGGPLGVRAHIRFESGNCPSHCIGRRFHPNPGPSCRRMTTWCSEVPASLSKRCRNIRPRYGRSPVARCSVCTSVDGGVGHIGEFLGLVPTPSAPGLHAVRRHDPLQDRTMAVPGQRQQPGRQAPYHYLPRARGDCFFGIGRTVLRSLTYRF